MDRCNKKLFVNVRQFKFLSAVAPYCQVFVGLLFLVIAVDSIARPITAVLLKQGIEEVNLSSDLACTSISRVNSTLQSSEDNLSFSHIQQQSVVWKPNNNSYLNYHFINNVLWCHVVLKNNTISNYRWFFVLDNTRLNFVNFYWLDDNKNKASIRQHIAGDHRSALSERSNMDSKTALPTFAITLPPDEQGHLYFAIDTDSVTWLRPGLYSGEAYGEMVHKRKLWQWLYAAAIIACIFLQLVITRFSAGWTEIYYLLAVTSGLFYFYFFFGDANILLSAQSGELKNNLLFIFNLGYQIFGLFFIKCYLRTKDFFPLLGRLFTLQIVLVFIGGLSIFFGFESNQNRVLIAASLTLLTGAVALVGIYNAIRQGLNWAWGLLISWAAIAVSGAVMALVFMGVIPFSSFTSQLLLWVFPFDVSILSSSLIFLHLRHIKELQHLQYLINQQTNGNSSTLYYLPGLTEEPPLAHDNSAQLTTAAHNDAVSTPIVKSLAVKDILSNKEKSAKKRLQGIDCEQKLKLLTHYYECKKAYCQEDISLNHVGEILGLRADQVSALINHQLGTSFSRFTNEYRVGEAKRLLLATPYKNLIDIAINSGFNSRASFSRVFKLHVQMSPAEFREKDASLTEEDDK